MDGEVVEKVSNLVMMPELVRARALKLAAENGIPVCRVVEEAEGFEFLSVAEVPFYEGWAPYFAPDRWALDRWSLSLSGDGSWVVTDQGRHDNFGEIVPYSDECFDTLEAAIEALVFKRQEATAWLDA